MLASRRPAISKLRREELVAEIKKWEPPFQDEGLTKPMLASILRDHYRANPEKHTAKLPSLAKMSKKELLDMCREFGLVHDPSDTVGHLQLIIRRHQQSLMEEVPKGSESVAFGQYTGETFDEIWENRPSYVKWVLMQAESKECSEMLMRLAKYLRARQAGLIGPDKPAASTPSPDGPATPSGSGAASRSSGPQPPPEQDLMFDLAMEEQMGPRKRRDTGLMEDTPANQREADYQNQMSDLTNMVAAMSTHMMEMSTRLNRIETRNQSDVGTEASFVMTHTGGPSSSLEDREKP